MRRHWSHRLSAIVFAVWFGIVGLAPGALGVCPMHESAGGIHATSASSAAHAAHAGHSMTAAGASDETHGGAPMQHSPTQSDHHAHHCSCPGCCCSVAALAVPVVASHGVFIAEIATTRPSPTVGIRGTLTDFVLPFATAPPAGRSA